MKYPIGIQTFSELRTGNWVYVDKTMHIYRMVTEGKCYFLSRPRRFGKSLLISTLEAYFRGQKSLFEGLAIADLEQEWKEYPVLHFDLNAKPFTNLEDLYELLNDQLSFYEQEYASIAVDKSPEGRFRQLIRSAKHKTGENVVVLIDEYDKPILQAIGNEVLQDEFRNTLKAFYGVLKSADADLRFTLLTGVTKFGKISVFSDLNNLNDITMDTRYSCLCGITEEELYTTFEESVAELAQINHQTKEEAYGELKRRYDGYHFAHNGQGIYNPFSLLNTFQKSTYANYWFATGTPTYLVELLKKSTFCLPDLSNYQTSLSMLDTIHSGNINPVPVLFQSGYLTIKGFDSRFKLYTLDYPNEEVKQGFIDFLLPYYTQLKDKQSQTIVSQFVLSLESGDVDRFMQLLQSLLADTPYELIRELENHYQNVIYIITKLMGFYVQAEYRTSRGRIDLLIGTDKYIYIVELKFDGSAAQALEQIKSKDYSLPFASGSREVIKIGANISSETRNIAQWLTER